eukprot:7077764-Prymnesium_polylepis.1
MRARRCPERASASGLGEMRPFVTATHQVDHATADSLDTVPTAGSDAAIRCRPVLSTPMHTIHANCSGVA